MDNRGTKLEGRERKTGDPDRGGELAERRFGHRRVRGFHWSVAFHWSVLLVLVVFIGQLSMLVCFFHWSDSLAWVVLIGQRLFWAGFH